MGLREIQGKKSCFLFPSPNLCGVNNITRQGCLESLFPPRLLPSVSAFRSIKTEDFGYIVMLFKFFL